VRNSEFSETWFEIFVSYNYVDKQRPSIVMHF